jgi:hypothetical protein
LPLRRCLVRCGFIGSRIDHEQELTRGDDCTVAEFYGVEITVNARAHIDAVGCLNRPVYSSHSVMRVTRGVATTTAGAAGGTGAAAERHPLRLALAITRHKSHELGGWHLHPAVTCDGMSDELRVDDKS